MKTTTVTSPSNPTFRLLLALGRGRGVRRHALSLLSGERYVREVLRDFPDHVEAVLLREGDAPLPWVDSLPLPGYRFSPQLFPQIDQFHTGPPILLLRCPPLPPWSGRPSVPGCTLCLPFQDPLNVGAVLRTAAAFGVLDIVHLKGSAHPFHPKALRAGGSAIFRTHLWRGPSLEGLAGLGDALVTLSPEGVPLEAFRWPETFCLAPGIEGAGLPAELKGARTLGIPMAAGVESLNAAMATGIALYHWRSGSRSGPLAVGR